MTLNGPYHRDVNVEWCIDSLRVIVATVDHIAPVVECTHKCLLRASNTGPDEEH